MRAMVLEKAGGPLLLRDVQKPVAGPGQVRARVVSNVYLAHSDHMHSHAVAHGHAMINMKFVMALESFKHCPT